MRDTGTLYIPFNGILAEQNSPVEIIIIAPIKRKCVL